MYNWDYKNSERKLTIRAEFGGNCTDRTLKLESPDFSQGKLNRKAKKELGFFLLTLKKNRILLRCFDYILILLKLEMFFGNIFLSKNE